MQFSRVNGVVLHHTEVGPRDARTIVFSNSLGTDYRIWDGVISSLSGRFRMVRYDKRGHGLSELGPEPYRMDDHIADLSALLDHLSIKRATIVGLSVGGMIAQGLSAKRRGLVEALVLCNTGHTIGTDSLWNERIAAVREGGIDAISDGVLQRWFSLHFRQQREEELAGLHAMLTRTHSAGYVNTSEAIRNTDLTEIARAISVPTLTIGGSEDGATPPELLRALSALIPKARFELIEGAGHLPCVEYPERVAQLINEFCLELP